MREGEAMGFFLRLNLRIFGAFFEVHNIRVCESIERCEHNTSERNIDVIH